MKKLIDINSKIIIGLSTLILLSGCDFSLSDKKEIEEVAQAQISKLFTGVDCATFDINSTELSCGYLKVPNDYFEKTTTYSIPVVIKRAKDSSKNLAPIIYVAGGPGESAVNRYKRLFNSIDYEDRDVILYDQRGTGYSKPFLECDKIFDNKNPILEKNLKEIDVNSDSFTQSDYNIYFQPYDKEEYDSCVKALTEKNQAPYYFTTKNSAYDIESLRQSLGANKIILLGVSYGTRLSLEYMNSFPQNLESVVLDGVTSKNQDFYSQNIIEKKDAIEKLFELCQNDIQCNDSYPDLKEEFLYIVNSLNKNPYIFTLEGEETIVYGHNLSFSLYELLYNEYYYSAIPYILHKIREGIEAEDYSFLQYLIDIFYVNQLSSEQYNSKIMMNFMDGNDYPYILNNMFDAYEWLGEYKPIFQKYAIFNWDTMHTSYLGVTEFSKHEYDNNISILLLSGTLDPATPLSYAQDVEQRLTNSTHLIFKNRGHGQFTNDCGKLTIKTFIENKDNFIPPECVNDVYEIEFILPDYTKE